MLRKVINNLPLLSRAIHSANTSHSVAAESNLNREFMAIFDSKSKSNYYHAFEELYKYKREQFDNDIQAVNTGKIIEWMNKFITNTHRYDQLSMLLQTDLYIKLKEKVELSKKMALNENQLLMQINNHLMEINLHQYFIINAPHAQYLVDKLDTSNAESNGLIFLLIAQIRGIVLKCDLSKYLKQCSFEQLMRMVEYNVGDKIFLQEMILKYVKYYQSSSALGINKTLYNNRRLIYNHTLANLIGDQHIATYLSNLYSDMCSNKLDVNELEKIELAINLIYAHNKTEFEKYSKFVIDCLSIPDIGIALKEIRLLRMLYWHVQHTLHEANFLNMIHQLVTNFSMSATKENLNFIKFIELNKLAEAKTVEYSTFISTHENLSIEQLSKLSLEILMCNRANKNLFKNILPQLIELHQNAQHFSQSQIVFIYALCAINPSNEAYKAILPKIKGFLSPMVCESIYRFFSNNNIGVNFTNHYELINDLKFKSINILSAIYLRNYYLTFYRSNEKMLKLAFLCKVQENPQLVPKILSANNHYSSIYQIITQTIPFINQADFISNLIKDYSNISNVSLAIDMCIKKRIDLSQINCLFNKYIPENMPLLLFFSHFFNKEYNPILQSGLPISTKKSLISLYVITRPYLDDCKNIDKYDSYICGLISEMDIEEISMCIVKLMSSLGNLYCSKALVSYMFKQLIRSKAYYRAQVFFKINVKSNQAIKAIEQHDPSNFRNLETYAKSVLYWGKYIDIIHFQKRILSDQIKDLNLNSFLESCNLGQNSDILYTSLLIPEIRDILIQKHLPILHSCLEKSNNWLLYMALKFGSKAIPIPNEIEQKIVQNMNTSYYMKEVMADSHLTQDLKALKLDGKISDYQFENGLKYPYYYQSKNILLVPLKPSLYDISDMELYPEGKLLVQVAGSQPKEPRIELLKLSKYKKLTIEGKAKLLKAQGFPIN